MSKLRRKQKNSKYLILLSVFLLLVITSAYAVFNTNINLKTKGNIKVTDESCFTIEDNGDGTASITEYDITCGQKVVIPSKINNLTVAKIADGKTIGQTEDGSNINIGPFTGKKIRVLILPNTITYIGKIAFFNTEITKLNIPSSVKKIGMQAFAFGSLEELTLNEGLEEIGFEAFSHNNLKTINIPNTVTKIGDGAFNTNLMNDENLFIYNRNADGTINYSYLNSYGNRTKTNIIFKDNIKRLGSHSLYLLDNLTELNIPNTVEEIDNEFIYNNKKLKTINIGSGIKIIHDNAFYGIRNNEELTININKKENQIEGTPWNGENIKVNWLG